MSQTDVNDASRGLRYHAFISYSHAADGRLAPAFQSGLQQLARPWYRLRAVRVFRDQTGLGITPELWAAIERALAASAYFILLASPPSAHSKWVAQEVDWWLRNRPTNRLLIVCTDGDLVWEKAHADFDWGKTSALPQRLQGAFPEEPLHLDLRWAKSATDLSLRHPRFADAVAGVAATLRGVPPENLISEAVKQEARMKWMLRLAMATLLVLSVSAFVALRNANEARTTAESLLRREEAKVVAQANEAKSSRLAAVAINQLAIDRNLAIQIAAEAVRIQASAAAESALRQSLAGELEPLLTLGPTKESGYGAVFNPEGTRALTWSDDDTPPQIYDAARGGLVLELKGHRGPVKQACFNKDGRRVATTGEDSEVWLWDAPSGKRQFQLSHPGVSAVLWSPDGSRILTLASGEKAMLWDASNGTNIAALDYSENFTLGDMVKDACFNPDGSRLVLSQRYEPVVLDAKTGALLTKLKGHPQEANSVAWSPDGKWLVTTAFQDNTARRWQAGNWLALTGFTHDAELRSAQVSPDGKWVAALDSKNLLLVWDAGTTEKVAQMQLFPSAMVVFRFSPNGKCLLTADTDSETAELWEAATGARLGELSGKGGPIRSLGFSPDGRRAIVGSFQAPARIYATDICGSAMELLALAGSRVPRQLTAEEVQKFLGTP